MVNSVDFHCSYCCFSCVNFLIYVWFVGLVVFVCWWFAFTLWLICYGYLVVLIGDCCWVFDCGVCEFCGYLMVLGV